MALIKIKMNPILLRALSGILAAGFTFAASAADEPGDPIGRFDISGYEVDGNTQLAPQEIRQLLAPYTGPGRNFGTVQQALEKLEDAYHKRGFTLMEVTLPEQELNGGVVHFHVVETRIGKVTVSGNRFFDEENVKRSLPALREGAIPNMPKVSANLRNANLNPSKHVDVQMKSGESDDEVDAAVTVVDEKPSRFGVSLDNTGTASTGRTHLGLLYQNANISGHDDVMSLQYTTSVEKPSKVNVFGAGYHLPLYGSGDSIDLYGSYSDVDSGTVSAGVVDLNVSGKGSVYGGRYNFVLDRVGNYDSNVSLGLDYKAFRNNVDLQGLQLGNDITVHPLSLSYSGSWTVAPTTVNFYAAAVHNVSGGTNGSQDDFTNARSGASASYNIFRYGASAARTLPLDWQARLALNGQWTRDELIPGEQFGAGGANSVRGFDEREVANDRGNTFNAELYTPDMCAHANRGSFQCRVLFFYDSAYLSRVSPLPGESASESIGSVGTGVRVALDKRFSLQADAGYVVDEGGSERKGDVRLHVALSLSY